MVTAPIINWTNVTQANQLLDLPNQTTGGLFWVVVVFLVFCTLLIIFLNLGWEVAFLGSAFITLIISIFLSYMEVLAFKWVLFFAGVILFMFIYIGYTSMKRY